MLGSWYNLYNLVPIAFHQAECELPPFRGFKLVQQLADHYFRQLLVL